MATDLNRFLLGLEFYSLAVLIVCTPYLKKRRIPAAVKIVSIIQFG